MKKFLCIMFISLFCCQLTACSYNGKKYFGTDSGWDGSADYFGSDSALIDKDAQEAYASGQDYLLTDFNIKPVTARANDEILKYDFIETSLVYVGTDMPQSVQQSVTNISKGGNKSYSDTDLQYMASCIESEAGSQSWEGKIAVGWCIMNRVNSSKFSQNTVKDVITAPKQFSSPWFDYLDGDWSEECEKAARAVLSGSANNPIGSKCFFCSTDLATRKGILDKGQQIGKNGNVFYDKCLWN